MKILSPFNPRESISVKEAAARAGKSVGAIRFWCTKHGVGRKIGGEVHVSRVALEMLLESDFAALHLYHAGERHTPTVGRYFAQLGLLGESEHSAQSALIGAFGAVPTSK